MTTFESLESRQLLAAGGLDPSFGGDGSVDVQTTPKSWGISQSDVGIDDQRRTLVAGLYAKQKTATVTRLNADGSRDTSFGSNGRVAIDLPAYKGSSRFQVLADHNGRVLIVAGNHIIRLTESGKPDKKFGGKLSETLVPIVSSITDVQVDAGNNPIVVGTSAGKTGTRGTIIRLTRLGKVDKTFGSGGAYKTPVPTVAREGGTGAAVGQTVKVMPDGKILGIAGISTRYPYAGDIDGDNGVSLFRLTASGALDKTYGTNGSTSVTTHFYDLSNGKSDVDAVFSDGSMLVAHRTAPYENLGGRSSLYDRIDANGQVVAQEIDLLPASIQTFTGQQYYTDVVAVGSDGKLIVRASDLLYRLNADYTLDTTFTRESNVGVNEVTLAITVDRGDGLILFNQKRDSVTREIIPSLFSVALVQV